MKDAKPDNPIFGGVMGADVAAYLQNVMGADRRMRQHPRRGVRVMDSRCNHYRRLIALLALAIGDSAQSIEAAEAERLRLRGR